VAGDPADPPHDGRSGRTQAALNGPLRVSGGRLTDLLAGSRRVALVGLAKNTGKTETLTAILAAHEAEGVPVGVTSIGRDGEERDVIDPRIGKPRVRLVPGSLVASTAPLLRGSGLAFEQLAQTAIRTPLGEVVVARVEEEGTVEVAGPSAAADVRSVSEAMLGLGARQVLIDGAIDRRAASSPAVSDALVMATGAVLGEDIAGVVEATAAAVELVRLPLADGDGEPGVPVARGLVLRGEAGEIAGLLREHPHADTFEIEGALGEEFLEGLLVARAARAGRALRVLAADPTHVFLSRRGPGWYRRQGISIEVREPIELRAITVNPVAPQAHSFPSADLREAISEAIPGVPVLDVRDPD
jgi:hypothetical protein